MTNQKHSSPQGYLILVPVGKTLVNPTMLGCGSVSQTPSHLLPADPSPRPIVSEARATRKRPRATIIDAVSNSSNSTHVSSPCATLRNMDEMEFPVRLYALKRKYWKHLLVVRQVFEGKTAALFLGVSGNGDRLKMDNFLVNVVRIMNFLQQADGTHKEMSRLQKVETYITTHIMPIATEIRKIQKRDERKKRKLQPPCDKSREATSIENICPPMDDFAKDIITF
jgi:hypothetical protein